MKKLLFESRILLISNSISNDIIKIRIFTKFILSYLRKENSINVTYSKKGITYKYWQNHNDSKSFTYFIKYHDLMVSYWGQSQLYIQNDYHIMI